MPRRAVRQNARMRARNRSSDSTFSPPAVALGFVGTSVESQRSCGFRKRTIELVPTWVLLPACAARTLQVALVASAANTATVVVTYSTPVSVMTDVPIGTVPAPATVPGREIVMLPRAGDAPFRSRLYRS
jgi:hypothetical protein